jgi:cell division septum initiation protein DivIVA
LKVHIRQTKSELKTGTADDNSGKAVLQPEEFLDRIKATNSNASRNVLKLREKVASTIVGKKRSHNLVDETAAEDKSIKKTLPRSKAQLLEKQVDSIARISEDLNGNNKKREALLDLKLSDAKVKNLKIALEFGLISQDEFESKAKALLLKDI